MNNPPKWDPTFMNPGSHFGGRFFSQINISPRFAVTFLFTKRILDIFEDCRKTFDEKRNKNRIKINDLLT